MESHTFATYKTANFTAAVACVLDLISPAPGEDFSLLAGWTANDKACWIYEAECADPNSDVLHYTIIREEDCSFTVVCTINTHSF